MLPMHKNAISGGFKKLLSNRTRAAIIIFVLLAIGFFGWQRIKSSSQQQQYQTARVELGTIISSITVSGQVLQASRMPVTTSASGIVKTVFVKNGDAILAGDPIAEITLDQQSQQKQAAAWANYLSAQNTLKATQAKINSLQSALFKANQSFVNGKGIANPSDEQKADPKYIEENAEWLQAEADYKNQEGVISQAQAAVRSTWLSYIQTSATVVAPIGGKVTDLLLQPGSVITNQSASQNGTLSAASQKIATMQVQGTLIVAVSLSEVDAPKVKAGNKTTFTFDALADKTFTGKVASIDTLGVVNSGVTTYPATIALDTGSSDIFPNMSATATIMLDTKSDVLLVPSSAVQTQGSNSFVRVLKNGHLEEVAVELGLSSDTQTEVISGLDEGEEVVTSITTQNQGQQQSTSPFGGGGVFRPGGFGGGGGGQRR